LSLPVTWVAPQPRGVVRGSTKEFPEAEMSEKGGMTEEEARRFHGAMVTGTLGYVVVAAVAHFLAWSWRPWF
jgi:light-harvesting complex 1 beta chain